MRDGGQVDTTIDSGTEADFSLERMSQIMS
jgi:hypothetical protein